MNKKKSSNASFSLVEALLAMTILSIAVTSILTTFSTAIMVGKLSEDYSIAATMMEELHAYVRTNQLSPFETNQGEFILHPEFTWIVMYYYTDITDLYQVEMQVMWRRGSRERSMKYTTYHYFRLSETSMEAA
ncbi:MAG: prepilin-type N-terminal cleavage/methylation domain-containing protein [Candidatus Omnitrophica bacterium]|nr:prepilin-type N-terminal cleavage/methylation domain-containing protein [Candidatus Omnitrophota bacterium]